MRGQEASTRLLELVGRVQSELEALMALQEEAKRLAQENERELALVCKELAAVYLPGLDAAALAEAERRTGFRGFSRRDPLQAMERERRKLAITSQKIQENPDYQRREYLVGSQGSLTAKVKEARENLEVWDRELMRFEGLEGFLELVEIGYDTPEFVERWWQADYWRHWAAGDRICAALGMADFGDDVLPAWKKAREPRDQWKAELERFTKQMRAVLDLVKSRDDAEVRLGRLEEIYLEECRGLLAEHLARADVALLEQWRGEDRGVEVLLRRLSGIAARRAFFEDLSKGGLLAQITALRERRAKMIQKAEKLARPKHAGREVPDPAPGLEQKLDALASRREKTLRQARRVQEFRDWDRYRIPERQESWFVVWDQSPPPVWAEDWRSASGLARPQREDGETPAQAAQPDFSSKGDLS